MKTSQFGLEFVAREEGEVLHVYPDQAGVPTIGVGHALRPGESFPNGITHEQAIAMLAGDIAIAEMAVAGIHHVPHTISQNAWDACVSLAFNIGGADFRSSSVASAIVRGELQAAADDFLLWDKRKDKTTGQLVQDAGLLARRKRERALSLTPDGVQPGDDVMKPIDPDPAAITSDKAA